MNCPRCRGRMEYIATESDPRARKTTWYCHSCNAWRLFQDGDGGDLRGFLIKSLNFDNIPASVFKKGSRKKSDVSICPIVS